MVLVGREAQRILAGDPGSWRRLVARRHGDLYRFLLHLTGRPDEAKDITQEAFVRLWERRGECRFRHMREVDAWLHRVAYRCAVDRARAERRSDAMGATSAGPSPEVALPHEAAERTQGAQRVAEAVATLSEEHRAVVLLHYFSGFPCGEIAEMLEIPRGTVISRLRAARGHLRRVLAEGLGETVEASATTKTEGGIADVGE
jgi:RNA polymerase sigma-70 factor (ECF subfamily)